MEQLHSHWTDFDRIWYLGFFLKICRENWSFITIRQEQRVLYRNMFSHLWQYLDVLVLEWEMFQIKIIEKMKTHILCSITLFRKSHRLEDNVEKCSGDRGATNDVTIWRIRVACWINKATCTYAPGYPHALARTQISNTCCFSVAPMIRERASMLRYTHITSLVFWRSAISVLQTLSPKQSGVARTAK
jgi:hypothetical protein